MFCAKKNLFGISTKRFILTSFLSIPNINGQELAPYSANDVRRVAKASLGLFPQPFWIRLFYALRKL
jgi:hypothetical protein